MIHSSAQFSFHLGNIFGTGEGRIFLGDSEPGFLTSLWWQCLEPPHLYWGLEACYFFQARVSEPSSLLSLFLHSVCQRPEGTEILPQDGKPWSYIIFFFSFNNIHFYSPWLLRLAFVLTISVKTHECGGIVHSPRLAPLSPTPSGGVDGRPFSRLVPWPWAPVLHNHNPTKNALSFNACVEHGHSSRASRCGMCDASQKNLNAPIYRPASLLVL